jgi:hypothetical protein
MPQIRHPLSGVVYDLAADGTVVLEKDGKTGRFTTRGHYLEGDIKQADPQLCGWIGGVQLPSRHQQMAEASLFADSAPETPETPEQISDSAPEPAQTAPGGAS